MTDDQIETPEDVEPYLPLVLGQRDANNRLLVELRICKRCGGAVADTELHDAFHDALAARRRHT